MTTERKLIEKQKECLELCYNMIHKSHIPERQMCKYYSLLDELSVLEKELEEQKGEAGMSAENKSKIKAWVDSLKYQLDYIENGYAEITVFLEDRELFERLMQGYRQAGIREELINYASIMFINQDDAEMLVDEYLKSKQ